MRATATGPATGPATGAGPAAAGFARASGAAAAVVLLAGALGTLYLRHWGRVGFRVPSIPWYYCLPFYVFPPPRLAAGWAAAALPVAVAAALAAVRLHRAGVGWAARVAATAALAAVLALAVAALAGGPRAWAAPFDYAGEYPAGAGRGGAIPPLLRAFPRLPPRLPGPSARSPPAAWPATSSASGAGAWRCWSGRSPPGWCCTWRPPPTCCSRRCSARPRWPPTGGWRAARPAGPSPAGRRCGGGRCSPTRQCCCWCSSAWPPPGG